MPPYSCTSVQYNQLDHESISEAKNLPKAMFVCLVKIKAWNEVFFGLTMDLKTLFSKSAFNQKIMICYSVPKLILYAKREYNLPRHLCFGM